MPRLHPLVKTYDETKRCRERVAGLVQITSDEQERKVLESIVSYYDDVLELVPKKFHKTRWDIMKVAVEEPDDEDTI